MSTDPSQEKEVEEHSLPVTEDVEKAPNDGSTSKPVEDETEYPSAKKLALILVALYFAMFLVALVSLPT